MVGIIATVIFWKKYQSVLTVISPKQCIIMFDDYWSQELKNSISAIIRDLYNSSVSIHQIIQKAMKRYPQINCIQAQICSSDSICFNVQAVKPVFIFNNLSVILSNGKLLNKNDISEQTLKVLPHVLSESLNHNALMIQFILNLPAYVALNNKIVWNDYYEIILHPHDRDGMKFLISIDRVPSESIMQCCQELHSDFIASRVKKKNNRSIMLYDLRFKNQIIMKPGG